MYIYTSILNNNLENVSIELYMSQTVLHEIFQFESESIIISPTYNSFFYVFHKHSYKISKTIKKTFKLEKYVILSFED